MGEVEDSYIPFIDIMSDMYRFQHFKDIYFSINFDSIKKIYTIDDVINNRIDRDDEITFIKIIVSKNK